MDCLSFVTLKSWTDCTSNIDLVRATWALSDVGVAVFLVTRFVVACTFVIDHIQPTPPWIITG